ncbi:MAG TPA: DUF3592 domain-containing protein [Tepidisphaeraceae bacterium]|jgi:hypothetical protein|nr:DUF3592 domain-containing protein [Tepidisphaeraceae bacterium]
MDARGLILPSRIVGLLCLLPALVTGGLAVWFYASTAAFVENAVSVPGIVIELKPSAGDNGTTYYSVFEYSDAAGTTRQSTTGWASNPPAHAVGDRVEVLYSPTGPSDVRLRSFMGLWFAAVLCAGLTVVPLVMAGVFLWLIPFAIRRAWPIAPAATA